MGRRKTIANPVRVHVNLHAEDYEAMKGFYPTATAAVAIRALVHQHVQAMRQKMAASSETLVPVLDLDFDLEDVDA